MPDGKRRFKRIVEQFKLYYPSISESGLSSKLLTQRAKYLARIMHCLEEDEALAAKLMNVAKTAQQAQRKKSALALLKAVQRLSYPRAIYYSILNETAAMVKDSKFLLTWEELLREANATSLTEVEAKEVVFAAIEVFNRIEDFNGKEMVGEGILAEVPVKLIEPAFEKAETIHHLRLILALHSEDEIIEHIRNNCKITGTASATTRSIQHPINTDLSTNQFRH
jgi:hypothetical protein